MVRRGAEDYLGLLQRLLPDGPVWTREEGADLTELLRGLAAELGRLDARLHDLLDEADPRTTLELLPDWEHLAGLPDPCPNPPDTIQGRRNALVAKLTGQGGQSPQYLIDVVAALGFEVTITEYTPWRVGEGAVTDPLYGEAWAYAFAVHAPETTIIEWAVGQSSVAEPLRSWGNAVLECVIDRLKPAHTVAIFSYGG